jgi:hypothetical protein
MQIRYLMEFIRTFSLRHHSNRLLCLLCSSLCHSNGVFVWLSSSDHDPLSHPANIHPRSCCCCHYPASIALSNWWLLTRLRSPQTRIRSFDSVPPLQQSPVNMGQTFLYSSTAGFATTVDFLQIESLDGLTRLPPFDGTYILLFLYY